jgi:hypothetical protein
MKCREIRGRAYAQAAESAARQGVPAILALYAVVTVATLEEAAPCWISAD